MFGFGEIFGTLHVHPLGKPFLNSVAFNFFQVSGLFITTFSGKELDC
jgi:hypothetical protein